jgi:hypothetical protein
VDRCKEEHVSSLAIEIAKRDLPRYSLSCLIEIGEEHPFMVFVCRVRQVCHRSGSFDHRVHGSRGGFMLHNFFSPLGENEKIPERKLDEKGPTSPPPNSFL